MSFVSLVLLAVIWLAVFEVLTSQSLINHGNHRNRHKFKRQQLFFEENRGYARLHQDNLPLQENSPSLLLDEDNENAAAEAFFELDKPLPIEQVSAPVGGKAFLPCDTRSSDYDHGNSEESSGFYMVMWFKEQNENIPEDYDRGTGSSSSIPSNSGEPIFTYDIRQSFAVVPNPPKWWSSPLGFGDRAYFHTLNSDQLKYDEDFVDHLTVDRAKATDSGIYRCRVDFFKAPTRNRLVNLTIIVAPDRPKIYFEYGISIGGDRPENFQQDSVKMIIVDEGSPSVTLVCRVNGGWPRPRLTWYLENAVLDSTYYLVTDDDYGRGHRKKPINRLDEDSVTVNRLLLTNLTRWHSIMSQRQRTVVGTARLTCQASNSIVTAGSSVVFRPAIAGNGNLPPPATTEHTTIRLNLVPTEVKIISVEEIENNAKTNGSHLHGKTEVFASEDTVGHKKYTIRADRLYRAECRSKGSRPLATIEWYLLKKNQRFSGQSTNGGTSTSSPIVFLGEKRGGSSMILEGTISSTVETQSPEMTSEDDELAVTTSVLSFKFRGPISAVTDENEENESILVCRAYNPVIKTIDRHYIDTKITLDVQYPPIVELRFGNRLLETGSIGPGDDVYFECVTRANPSSTISYSWYHNGVRLTQEWERRRTDDGEKKKNRLASRVILYSQLGSLVLQSVKTTAAGKYACRATNGIGDDSDENVTMSNTVRLYVKHVPVCQHREEIVIYAKKSDAVTGPVIKCLAGRGHPPTIEYQWTFHPEETDHEIHNNGPFESNGMAFAGRSATGDSLIAEKAVHGRDPGLSYTFTTSTPVLKLYITASSASSNAVRPNFLRGRLECRAVNTMGTQIRPCVYRLTDKMAINEGSNDVQENTDCQSILRQDMSNEADKVNQTHYPCGATVKDVVTSTYHKTRFCILCTLNTSSLHNHKQKIKYVLQLFMTTRDEVPATTVVAFNVTGVTVSEDNGNSRTGSDDQVNDDDYFDLNDEYITDGDRSDDNYDNKNVIQRVVFVIDDSVDPGIYRGRIYNSDEDIISAMVKGMINVASEDFDDKNENNNPNNYIIDDNEDVKDESILEYVWRRLTVPIVDMFSMVTQPSSHQESERVQRGRQTHKHWQAMSVVLTAMLVTVVIALSCGICGVVAILYRRQFCNQRTNQGHVNGHGSNDGDADVNDDTGKIIVRQRKTVSEAARPAVGVGARDQRQPAMSLSRRVEYAADDDASNNNHAEVSAPLLQREQNPRVRHQSKEETNSRSLSLFPLESRNDNTHVTVNAVVSVKNTTASYRDDSCSGPDLVMSTATMNPIIDGLGGNRHKKYQLSQLKFSVPNSNHRWSLYRLQRQKTDTVTSFSRSTLTTTETPTMSVVLTSKQTKSKIKTVIDDHLSVPPHALLSALHRESSI